MRYRSDRGNGRLCDKDRTSRTQLIFGDLWEAGRVLESF